MLGAIIGDIVGSRFEWNNLKSKDFDFFTNDCHFTDDSAMTLAVIYALLHSKPDYSDLSEKAVNYMQKVGRIYASCGYGGNFKQWILSENPQPYNSWGNGSAMRVSACGFIGKNLAEVKQLSRAVTDITHNHPEGIKGAEATAVCIYLARTGKNISEIKNYVQQNYYPMDFTLDEIRPEYKFHVSCQKSVPQALEAFFESLSFEDAIRNAVSIGGDSDTIAAITGGIAEAYYGIPQQMKDKVYNTYLDDNFKNALDSIYQKVNSKETNNKTKVKNIRLLKSNKVLR